MSQTNVTQLLVAATEGDERARADLMPLVYEELKRRANSAMRRERAGHTLQPTALVHEVYLRLVKQDQVDWKGRAQFFAVSSQMMRRLLVDHARGRRREKRGGDSVKVSLDDGLQLAVTRDPDVIALDDALQKLAELDEQQARIVEMRFFGGLTVAEVAETLGVSKRTVEGEWTMIKAWLRRELGEE